MEKDLLKINYYLRNGRIPYDKEKKLQIFLMTLEKINHIVEKETNLLPESILLINMLFRMFNKEIINDRAIIQNKKFIELILKNKLITESLIISNFSLFYTLKKIVKEMINLHKKDAEDSQYLEYTNLLEKLKYIFKK